MTKHLLTALTATLVALAALYAVQPIEAAVPPAPEQPALALPDPFGAPGLTMPPPQEPFDMTPITPVESAGAPFEL
ncbi:hypothetical protein [Variovorax sp. MHTC-1]|uniref:hypothetical protein n=1 Tax=Variovorax sp. MHTC-1 TaxID=2495593 RepID=UPI000F88E7D9|nr:hypothetical protein [Variovorax sp. MHTC-1]RST48878.1 hypothetical protein EJI01_25465 [Variovorax sp. MHTC-1]